jgi:hypothetical protein
MTKKRKQHKAATAAHASTTWRKVAYWTGQVVVPAAIAAVGSRRSRIGGAVAGGLTALFLGGLRYQFQRWFTDEPSYDLERRLDGGIEIRKYHPHLEARTRIPVTDHDDALERGFRVLAGYLFGGNRDGEGETGEKLAMTAPVLAQRSAGGAHTMAFVMPPGRTLASLPQPDDDRVKLEAVPARRLAVLPFRGRYNGESVVRHERELLDKVREAGLQPRGEPVFAGFDPPNTIPWLRRNEVWVEVA